MAVTVRPVTEAVGAEISGVDLRSPSDQDFAAMIDLLQRSIKRLTTASSSL